MPWPAGSPDSCSATCALPAILLPARAVGTNLVVGLWVGVAGVLGHFPSGVDWVVLAVGAAASVPGALIGARLTGRLSEAQLLRAMGAVLVLAGFGPAAQGLA